MRESEKDLMNYISMKYLCVKKKIDYARYYEFNYPSDQELEFISLVEAILDTMDFENEMIIRNDYLTLIRERKWWSCFFTRSTYFRKKSKAVEEFLRCFKF